VTYTTADLISNVKRRSFLPTAQTQFTDQKLLDIGNDAVLSTIAPMLRRMDQGYWLEPFDQTLTADTSSYLFPRYAMWNKVNAVHLVDSSGVVVQALNRIEPYNLRWGSDGNTGTPTSFYFEHDKIVLVPAPSSSVASSLSLRQWIYRRPNRMVTESAAAKVSTAAGALVTYTGDKPSTFTSSSVHDFFSGVSPFGRVGTAKTATASAATTTQGFAAGDVALLSAGSWVCLQDETVFPPLPIEIVTHLETLIVLELAQTQTDQTAWQMQVENVKNEIQSVMQGAGNRADAQPKTLSLLNAPIAKMFGARGRRMVKP